MKIKKVIEVDSKVVDKFESRLEEIGEIASFEKWLESELSVNSEVVYEMLLGDV